MVHDDRTHRFTFKQIVDAGKGGGIEWPPFVFLLRTNIDHAVARGLECIQVVCKNLASTHQVCSQLHAGREATRLGGLLVLRPCKVAKELTLGNGWKRIASIDKGAGGWKSPESLLVGHRHPCERQLGSPMRIYGFSKSELEAVSVGFRRILKSGFPAAGKLGGNFIVCVNMENSGI